MSQSNLRSKMWQCCVKKFQQKKPLDYFFAPYGRAQGDGTWCLLRTVGIWDRRQSLFSSVPSPPATCKSQQSLTGWRNDHLSSVSTTSGSFCGSWNPVRCRHCIASISQRGIRTRNSLTLPSTHKWQMGTLFRTQTIASAFKLCALSSWPNKLPVQTMMKNSRWGGTTVCQELSLTVSFPLPPLCSEVGTNFSIIQMRSGWNLRETWELWTS